MLRVDRVASRDDAAMPLWQYPLSEIAVNAAVQRCNPSKSVHICFKVVVIEGL